MLASSKYSRQQNVGVDKILRSPKSRFDKRLAHARKHLLTVLAGQSLQQLTSPRPRWYSPSYPSGVDPSTCCRQVFCCRWPPRFYGQTLPHFTGLLYLLAMQKTSHILVSTKYWYLLRFHWFSPNYSSLCIFSQASFQKWWKQKVITITVQYQFTYS